MEVLIDTSVWIDYFKGTPDSSALDFLIDENLIVINDLILAELIPVLRLKKQAGIITLLQTIRNIPLNIDWHEIIGHQTDCLKQGINGIRIPDLLIAQNAQQNDCQLYSLDKHFKLLAPILKLEFYSPQNQ